MKQIKKVLLINDLTSMGKCSLTVSIPILSAYGIETIPVPTLLLSNHTGFDSYVVKDNSEALIDILNEFIRQDVYFDSIYTGFFKDANQIDIVIDLINKLKKENTTLFVDPILGEEGKLFKCFNEEYLNSMKRLVSMADYIAPNITEASLLTDSNINDDPISIINKFSNKNVVITSIRKDDEIGYLVKDEDLGIREFYNPYIDKKLHGTGDVFSSVLCANMLILDDNFAKSCLFASNFTNNAIIETLEYSNVDYGLVFENLLRRLPK